MSYNVVRATGLTGIYKGNDIEVQIGKTYADTIVKINGKKVENCQGVWIKCVVGKITSMHLEFNHGK